jgi:hypothetical protein
MPEPVFNALLMADKVITEDNGKKAVIGIFDRLNFPAVPAVAPPWFIYASFANLDPENEVTVNIARKESQEVVFSAQGAIQAPRASGIAEILLPVPPIKFNRAGKYIVAFILNGREVASRVLDVAVIGETST